MNISVKLHNLLKEEQSELDASYKIEKNKDNIIIISKNGRALHSKYNINNECKRALENINKNKNLLIIYGYGLETFKAKEEGSPYKIIDGRYNFTDPRSLIFFNDNFPQFSGFSTNDTEKLDNFLSFKEVKWEVPKYFIISNYISAFLHIIVIIILVLYLVYKIFIKK